MKKKDPDEVLLTQSSYSVNLFDLTKSDQGIVQKPSKEPCCQCILKIFAILFIICAIFLLVVELVALSWQPKHEEQPRDCYSWKKWFTQSVSDVYRDKWNKLTLHQKRQELLRATYGEVDLYDVYGIHKPKNNADSIKLA